MCCYNSDGIVLLTINVFIKVNIVFKSWCKFSFQIFTVFGDIQRQGRLKIGLLTIMSVQPY